MQSLLTVKEIDGEIERQKTVAMHSESTESLHTGRDIPSGLNLDITAGEE
ncbi:hypothetical protein [Metabacillus schmidteae]|nr:hypothetical protein [Metabacillus schmidteae]